VINATSTKLLAEPICRGKAEIGDSDSKAAVEAEDVLGFEVPMIYSQRMAIFDGVEKLKEYMFNQVILTEVTAMVQYLRKEVSIGSVVHDEVGVAMLLHNPVEGDNIRMG
jgi:hypothetical protein